MTFSLPTCARRIVRYLTSKHAIMSSLTTCGLEVYQYLIREMVLRLTTQHVCSAYAMILNVVTIIRPSIGGVCPPARLSVFCASCHSVWKRKDRFGTIRMSKRFLHLRTEYPNGPWISGQMPQWTVDFRTEWYS